MPPLFHGTVMENGMVALHGPGTQPCYLVRQPGELFGITLPVRSLLGLPEESGFFGGESLDGRDAIVERRPGFDHMVSCFRGMVEALVREPSILDAPEARSALDGLLVNTASEYLRAGGLLSRTDHGITAAMERRSVLSRCRDFIAAAMGRPIQLQDLCINTGVGKAELEQLFRQECGIHPMNYIKVRRLQSGRHAMLIGCASPKDASASVGCWDLGHFSVEYRNVFGESPASTVERCSHKPSSTEMVRLHPHKLSLTSSRLRNLYRQSSDSLQENRPGE